MTTHFKKVLNTARPLAMSAAFVLSAGAVALAQTTPMQGNNYGSFDPQYDTVNAWNTAWDTGTYDRHHVLLGVITDSKPYRLLLAPADPDGHATMVDLKNGTIIRPDGATLVPGMNVAVLGYWSKGTFIANRIVLRAGN
jgi:hypothetical protein